MITAYLWLALLVVFLVAEGISVALTSLWFAVGCLGAMLVSILGGPIWLQITVFFAISLTLLILLRPFVRKIVQPRLKKTNVDDVPGKVGLVTQAIDNLIPTGQIKLDAAVWTARSTTGAPIPEGTLVRVDRIQGVRAFVTPVNPQQ